MAVRLRFCRRLQPAFPLVVLFGIEARAAAPQIEPPAAPPPAAAAAPPVPAAGALVPQSAPVVENRTAPAAPAAQPQEGARPEQAESATEPEGTALGDGPEKKKKKKKKKDELVRLPGDFSVKGRVFVLAELSRKERTRNVAEGGTLVPRTEHPHALDLSVPTARASLKYQAPQEWLSAEIEVEIADGPDMRDGYIQAKGRHLSAKLGQFKLPVSAYAMESLWDLPVVRRGLLHEILTDWLDVGGRVPGAMFGVRGRGGIKPSLTLGVFQGRVAEEITPGDRNTDPISLDTTGSESYLDAQSYVGRVGAELADLVDVGLYYEHRVGSPAVGEFEHYPTAGVDAVLDSVFDNGGLRVWFDAMLGKSWYEHVEKVVDDDDATFMAARLCAGFRFGGVEPDQAYVEPFALFSMFEPDRDVVDDLVYEAALGVNVGYWDRARIALQGELASSGRNFPHTSTGYFSGSVPDRLGLLLQGAVAF
jgi:hypothetical protein